MDTTVQGFYLDVPKSEVKFFQQLAKKMGWTVSAKETLNVETSTSPSPSGDTWFDDPENMASVMRGIEDAEQGRKKAYTMDELRNLLGV